MAKKTEDFRRDAVNMVLTGGLTRPQLADDLFMVCKFSLMASFTIKYSKLFTDKSMTTGEAYASKSQPMRIAA